MAKPILKWAGGKRQLIDSIRARLPETYDAFHEPFFGGGTVFFDCEPEAGTLNDTNPRIVNFYKQVRGNPAALIKRLRSYRSPAAPPDESRDHVHTDHEGEQIKNYYYQQRAIFNKRPYGDAFDPVEEAALLLYLNRTCYNGLYRENGNGRFNVPVGQQTNPDWVQANRIRTASQLLESIDIFNQDFEYVVDIAEAGDFVYFDPPYKPTSPTASFTEYSAGGFSHTDQERLRDTAQHLDENGVYVLLSNSGGLHDMYQDIGFSVTLETTKRNINSDATNRDDATEIIATNIPDDEQQGPRQQELTRFL